MKAFIACGESLQDGAILCTKPRQGPFHTLWYKPSSFQLHLSHTHLSQCTWHGRERLCPARCPPPAWRSAGCPAWAEGWRSRAGPRHSSGRVAVHPGGCARLGSLRGLPPPACHTKEPGQRVTTACISTAHELHTLRDRSIPHVRNIDTNSKNQYMLNKCKSKIEANDAHGVSYITHSVVYMLENFQGFIVGAFDGAEWFPVC